MTNDERWYAHAFDAAYLEVYAHRDDAEAERATQRLLEPLGLERRRVLDLACGAGRHARAVAKRGAHVVGLDLSTELLARARLETPANAGVDYVRGDMLHLPFKADAFGVVLSMFTSFGYFAREADDRRVLEEIRRILEPAGSLILDVFNAERVQRDLVPETRRRAGRFDVHERRRIDRANQTVVKHIELVDGANTHRYEEIVRMWSRPELEDTLQRCDFDVESGWGDYDANAFDVVRSPRLILHARARTLA